jgi:23S rRNA pseudouridine2605 synthase
MISKQRRQRSQVSLARALSKMGVASRAEATRLIRDGGVEVNGKVVRDPGLWLDPRVDRITRRGKTVRAKEKIYLALHKPAGVVTTRSDEKARKTVYHLLPPDLPWVFPIGRLDKESSGLLLLSNDTEFGEAVTNPARKIEKRYHVCLDHPLSDPDKQTMLAGMNLRDGTVLSRAVVIPGPEAGEYEIGIWEGKNRQIRRMCEELGYEVQRLHRIRIGEIWLDDLKEGECRKLSQRERDSILGRR